MDEKTRRERELDAPEHPARPSLCVPSRVGRGASPERWRDTRDRVLEDLNRAEERAINALRLLEDAL